MADDDWLVRALADARAAFTDPSLRAEAMLVEAAVLILAAEGEASRRYVSIVQVAADRAFQRGDVCQGEALLRRARFLSEQVGDVATAAEITSRLAASVVGRHAAKRLDLERGVIDVEVQHTLARWMPAQVGFQGSGDRPKRWTLLAPRRWCATTGGGEAAVERALTAIFADRNQAMNATTPADPNYLMLSSFTHRALDGREVAAAPWRELAGGVVWELSSFFVVDDDAWFAADPADFVPMALTTRILAGELTTAAALDALAGLGFDRADWARRLQDPAAELRAALDHYVA